MAIFKSEFLQLPEKDEKIAALTEIFNNMIKDSLKPECSANLSINVYNPHAAGLARKIWEGCTRFEGPTNQDDPAEFLQNCLFTYLEEKFNTASIKNLLKTISYQEEKIDIFRQRERREPIRNQYILQLTTGLEEKKDSVDLQLTDLIQKYQDWELLEKYTDEYTGESYNISKRSLPAGVNQAQKRVELKNFGDYLLIQLKRIGFNKKTQTLFKYENKIIAPSQIIINRTSLKLEGAILHYGGAGGGHYTYGLIGKDYFYNISDNTIEKKDLSFITSDEFYKRISVLLYKKVSPETAAAEREANEYIEAIKDSLEQTEVANIAYRKGVDLMLVDRLHKITKRSNSTKRILNLMKTNRPITLKNIVAINKGSDNSWNTSGKKMKSLEKIHNIRGKQPVNSKIKIVATAPKGWLSSMLPFKKSSKKVPDEEVDLLQFPKAQTPTEINLLQFPKPAPKNINVNIWAKVPQEYKNIWNSLDSEMKEEILEQV